MRGSREDSHELVLERPWIPILDDSAELACASSGAFLNPRTCSWLETPPSLNSRRSL